MLAYDNKTILKVALPMMGSSFIQSIVLMTDSAFLTRYDNDAYAAAGNAGLIYVALFMIVTGMSDGAQILISRKIGEKNFGALGRVLSNAQISLLAMVSVLFVFSYYLMPDFIQGYAANPRIASMQGEYLSIRSVALFFALIQLPLQAYYFAWGRSIVPFIATIITAVGNVILDYGLIFGKLGFPEMGLAGAAWASTIADGLGAIMLLSYTLLSKEHIKNKLFETWKLEKESIKELFKLSIPIIAQGTLALMIWAVYFAWLEQRGVFEVTVSQNIRNIYFLAFIPVFGFATTTKTYVSQYFGAKQLSDIPKIQKRLILLSLIFMVLVFHGGMLYPDKLVGMINPNEEFIAKSADTLRFIAPSMLLFCIGAVFLQSINGIGRTYVTFFIELVITGSYLLYSYFTIRVWKWDVQYIWTVEYIYFGLMIILSYSYLKWSNWNKI